MTKCESKCPTELFLKYHFTGNTRVFISINEIIWQTFYGIIDNPYFTEYKDSTQDLARDFSIAWFIAQTSSSYWHCNVSNGKKFEHCYRFCLYPIIFLGIQEKKLPPKLIIWCNQDLHSVAKVYAVFSFYDVKCLCSGGREWGREGSHSL